jgi:UDP-N-acetyl-D-glucosamine dehydrogenase
MDYLESKIIKKEAVVGIVGLGYVGLPLAVQFCEAGFSTVGFDIARTKVDAVNNGISPVMDIECSLLKQFVSGGRLKATDDFSAIERENIDVIIICVPTPLNKTKDPDVSYIIGAAREIKKYLKKNQIIVLESTTYPGFTREALLPILEETGLKAGSDFHLAFSPERIDPANKTYNVKNTPKVVGGFTPACTKLASALYASVLDSVFPVSSMDAAEMAKLLENTFRAVNIGLVNELAIMCSKLKVNVWEVIDAAATKPFGYMPFYPGPGLGGHCIPIDPLYLSWKMKSLKYQARFIELADAMNTSMPFHVVQIASDALNINSKCIKGSRILLLGVTYKRDIDDVRESPSLDIIELLLEKAASVSYHDPYVQSILIHDHIRMKSVKILDEFFYASAFMPEKESGKSSQEAHGSAYIRDFDAVIIVTDHSCYNWEYISKKSGLIIDTRNAARKIKERKNIYLL